MSAPAQVGHRYRDKIGHTWSVRAVNHIDKSLTLAQINARSPEEQMVFRISWNAFERRVQRGYYRKVP